MILIIRTLSRLLLLQHLDIITASNSHCCNKVASGDNYGGGDIDDDMNGDNIINKIRMMLVLRKLQQRQHIKVKIVTMKKGIMRKIW